MQFIPTKLEGAYVLEPERLEDERGFFARTWCVREFEQVGISVNFVQGNLSYNLHKGTLRGLHYQAEPFAEEKLVSCAKGVAFDVIIDLRRDSETYLDWDAVELTASNKRMVYIPKGMAHGFQTLERDTELLYQMGEFYHPESARGIRWDDPALQIPWPIKNPVVSPKDQSFQRIGESVPTSPSTHKQRAVA